MVVRSLAKERLFIAKRMLLEAADLANEIAAREFATKQPIVFCEFLGTVARLAERRIDKLLDEISDTEGVNSEREEILADLLLGLARKIVEHLRYPERAVALETPWSIAETLAEFGQQLCSAKIVFIVRPMWSYNYAIIGNFREYYQHKLERLYGQSEIPGLDPERSPIYVVSFPRLEKTNALLHMSFAHELGHLITNEWLKDKNKVSKLKNEISKELKKKPEVLQKVDVKTLAYWLEESSVALERALNELIADIAAVMLFGPCFLFALWQIPLLSDLGDCEPSAASQYYPPWRDRLRIIIDNADLGLLRDAALILRDYGGSFIDTEQALDQYIANVKEFTEKPVDRSGWKLHLKVVYDVIMRHLEELGEWVRGRIGNMRYRGDPLSLARLCRDLENRIPPSLITEEGAEQETDFRDILNAGWLYHIVQFRPSMTNDTVFTYTILNKLILKAIESSYLLKHYRGNKNEHVNT